jgi:hypothetical protein
MKNSNNFQNHSLILTIDINVVSPRGVINFFVVHNDQMNYKNILSSGNYVAKMALNIKHNNVLKIGIRGKRVVKDLITKTNIVSNDKYVEINSLKINEIDLLADREFFNRHFEYYNCDEKRYTDVQPGFWSNAEIILKYPVEFEAWYLDKKNQN